MKPGYYPGRATHAETGLPVVPDPEGPEEPVAEPVEAAPAAPLHPAHILNVLEENGYRYVMIDKQLESIGDEPAVVYADGTKFWYRAGKLHRDGDKPAVVYPNGVEEWWQNHQRHRNGGPAVIFPDSAGVMPEYRGLKQHWQKHQLVSEDIPPHLSAYRAGLAALRKLHFGEE